MAFSRLLSSWGSRGLLGLGLAVSCASACDRDPRHGGLDDAAAGSGGAHASDADDSSGGWAGSASAGSAATGGAGGYGMGGAWDAVGLVCDPPLFTAEQVFGPGRGFDVEQTRDGRIVVAWIKQGGGLVTRIFEPHTGWGAVLVVDEEYDGGWTRIVAGDGGDLALESQGARLSILPRFAEAWTALEPPLPDESAHEWPYRGVAVDGLGNVFTTISDDYELWLDGAPHAATVGRFDAATASWSRLDVTQRLEGKAVSSTGHFFTSTTQRAAAGADVTTSTTSNFLHYFDGVWSERGILEEPSADSEAPRFAAAGDLGLAVWLTDSQLKAAFFREGQWQEPAVLEKWSPFNYDVIDAVMLDDSGHALVLTHADPGGDSLGSSVARYFDGESWQERGAAPGVAFNARWVPCEGAFRVSWGDTYYYGEGHGIVRFKAGHWLPTDVTDNEDVLEISPQGFLLRGTTQDGYFHLRVED